jgi:hypothetical protein
MRAGWTRADLLLAGGATVALAASADTAWWLRARFALDLEGLSAFDRAAAALWDFRPLGTAVFALAAIAALIGAFEGPTHLERMSETVRAGIAILAGAHAALAVVVAGLAVWVAAAGEIGRRDELGFVYSTADRTLTLVTQLLAWLPLAALLVVLAVLAVPRAHRPDADDVPSGTVASVSEEMEALWTEQLAHGPSRERARMLLRRIHTLEENGDMAGAEELAEQMRRLQPRG